MGPWPALLVVIVGVILATAGVAAAASLGGLRNTGMTVDKIPATRCDTLVRYAYVLAANKVDTVSLTDLAPACAGKVVQVTLVSSTGAVLATGTATAATGTASVAVAPSPTATSVAEPKVAIGGFPVTAQANGPTVSHVETITQDWGTGYCAQVDITTTSTTPIAWQVQIPLTTYPLNGTPYDVWTATWSFANQTLTASGPPYAVSVQAGQTRSFGFCANRPTPAVATATATASIYSDWGAGYCANVTVTSTSTVPIVWQVEIKLNKAPLNGTPYNVFNATATMQGNTMTAVGIANNNQILMPGQPRTFGFCANR